MRRHDTYRSYILGQVVSQAIGMLLDLTASKVHRIMLVIVIFLLWLTRRRNVLLLLRMATAMLLSAWRERDVCG